MHFTQGKTEYGWRTVEGHRGSIPVVVAEESFADRMRLAGMPKGYPHTVAPGFRRFFHVSLLGSFVSNFAASVATQCLLGGFFADATPQVWMLKDLAPALIAAIVANKVVSYEGRPKFWIVVSAVLTQSAVIADLFITSLVEPQHYLIAAVVTSTLKQSAFLMFFVARACALQHFATNQNLAEVTKKFNSFGMVNFTVATALGIAFTTAVPNFSIQIVTVLCCAVMTVITQYVSMAPIAFRVLTPGTASVVFRKFIESDFNSVPTPDDVSEMLGMSGHAPPYPFSDFYLVNPPVPSLDVSFATIDSSVIVLNDTLKCTIGLWPLNLSPSRRCWRRAMRVLSSILWGSNSVKTQLTHGDMRLVLFVWKGCDVKGLLCAHLMIHAAIAAHGDDLAALQAFLKECSRNNCKLWMQKAELLMLHMKNAGWDVNTVPIDSVEMRVSLMFQQADEDDDHGESEGD